MAFNEKLDIGHIGIDMDLLADPITKSAIDYSYEFLAKTQDEARENLAKAGKDPSLSILVFRSNLCLHSVELSDRLREIGINSSVLINDHAVEEEKNTSLFKLTDKTEHVLLSIITSDGSEVILDPFYSQFLEQFGMSFDLAFELGDSRVFPKELMLAFKPDQIDQLVEWVTDIVLTFWDRVARGDLRLDTDIFTQGRPTTSLFELAAGIKYDPIRPTMVDDIDRKVRQIWDRSNYRLLTQNQMLKLR